MLWITQTSAGRSSRRGQKSLDEALEIAIECEAFQTAEMQRPNFHNHVRNIETGHGTVKAETTVLPVLQEV